MAALALFFGLHVYRWHAPYRLDGVWAELPLLAIALVAGVGAGFALPRLWSRLARARLASAAVGALIAFLVLQAVDPFVAERNWRYAPAGCDFAVAFPRRADFVAGEARLTGVPAKPVMRAVLTDVGDATTFSAECVGFERPLGNADKMAVLDAAAVQLEAAAARLRIKVERAARADGNTILLSGFSDEGRTAANAVLLRRVEARAVLGDSSLLVLWAWKIGRAGESAPFGDAFFASVRPVRPR